MKNSNIFEKFAEKFRVDTNELIKTLKNTVFKLKSNKDDGPKEVTNEQLVALLIVADQYGLNPFTREIVAFVDKQGGVVPAVTVDGWCKIINNQPQFDGVEFRFSDEIVELDGARPCPAWCEAIIYRKDRKRPTCIPEYLDEVYRPPFIVKKSGKSWKVDGPWQTHTKRMLRHKALIQCARIAFGFSGIYDEDEAARIVETREKEVVITEGNISPEPALPQSGGVIIDMDNEQEKIPVALLKQIEIRAKQQGIEVPEFTSKEEAQSFLNNLLQKREEASKPVSNVKSVSESSEPETEEAVNETEELELW